MNFTRALFRFGLSASVARVPVYETEAGGQLGDGDLDLFLVKFSQLADQFVQLFR